MDNIDKAVEYQQAMLDAQIQQCQSEPNDVMFCIDCGEPIGEQRKKAVPHAVRCITCQNALEQGG